MSEDQATPDSPSSAEASHDESVREIPRVPPNQLVRLALLVESACVIVALGLAYFGLYDPGQPIDGFLQLKWWKVSLWSLLGFVAISVVAATSMLLPWKPLSDFREFVERNLIPLFAPLSVSQVALISICAGIGEELLFRWSIQGGLQRVLPGSLGLVGAMTIASCLFGAMHAVNWVYFWLASLIGFLLGVLMWISGSVVPAMAAHALYDFAAILYLRRSPRCHPDDGSANESVIA